MDMILNNKGFKVSKINRVIKLEPDKFIKPGDFDDLFNGLFDNGISFGVGDGCIILYD